MNYKEKESLQNEMMEAIKSAITQSHVIENIARLSTTEYQKYLSDAHAVSNTLIKTFKTIALLYNTDAELSIHTNIDQLQLICDKLIKTIESKVKLNEIPKYRMLTYTVSDEYGHSSANTVTDKDILDVECILYAQEYRDSSDIALAVFEPKNGTLGKIAKGLIKKFNIPYDKDKRIHNLFDTDKTFEYVTEFFQDVINDNSISTTEFAEMLTEIIPTGRDSGSYNWITIG